MARKQMEGPQQAISTCKQMTRKQMAQRHWLTTGHCVTFLILKKKKTQESKKSDLAVS
jgi:hypothetical protein